MIVIEARSPCLLALQLDWNALLSSASSEHSKVWWSSIFASVSPQSRESKQVTIEEGVMESESPAERGNDAKDSPLKLEALNQSIM